MGADDDDETTLEERQGWLFLEEYAPETKEAPEGHRMGSETSGSARRTLFPAEADVRSAYEGPGPVGPYWSLVASWLDVAEYTLRAAVTVSRRSWQPPWWLREAVISKAQVIRSLAEDLERKVSDAWSS